MYNVVVHDNKTVQKSENIQDASSLSNLMTGVSRCGFFERQQGQCEYLKYKYAGRDFQ